jgi:DNA-binding phage protein
MEQGQFSGAPGHDTLLNGQMNGQATDEQPQKKRRPGRPPGSRKIVSTSAQEKLAQRSPRGRSTHTPSRGQSSLATKIEINDEKLAYTLEEEKLSPFSSLLRSILRHDRSEIARVARELEVAENTIYRWVNGSSEPRLMHLRRLPDVLAEHRGNLTYAINQTFPGLLDAHAVGIQQVRKDIYWRVLDLVYTLEEPETRFWQVAQTLFEYALLHLDAERRGMAIIYASLMSPHADGIHSLRETVTRGSAPWPHTFESKVFLGSTTLAGHVAVLQRLQTWDSTDPTPRFMAEVDEHERSACAVPVMRGSHLAGVLLVSSHQNGFFDDPMARKAVDEYAHLLAIALLDKNFYPYSTLSLRPMPPLTWQREQIAASYVQKILTYVGKYAISRTEAELRVSRELELEFEIEGRRALDRKR